MKQVLAHAELSFKGLELLEGAGFKIINQHYKEHALIDFINAESISILYISASDFANAC